MLNFFKRLFAKKKPTEPVKVIRIPGIYSNSARQDSNRQAGGIVTIGSESNFTSALLDPLNPLSPIYPLNMLAFEEDTPHHHHTDSDTIAPTSDDQPQDHQPIDNFGDLPHPEVQGGSQIEYPAEGVFQFTPETPVQDTLQSQPEPSYGSDNDYGNRNDYGNSNDYGSRDSSISESYSAPSPSNDSDSSYSNESSYDSGSSNDSYSSSSDSSSSDSSW